MTNRKYPFGYGIENGKITVNDVEADAVRKIYSLYIGGASFNVITAGMNSSDIAYETGREWNKNTVARILKNEKYTGCGEYETIISEAEAAAVRELRSARQTPCEQTELQKELRRLMGRKPTEKAEAQTVAIMAVLRAEPDMVSADASTNTDVPRLGEMESTLKEMTTTSDFDETTAEKLVADIAAAKLETIGSEDWESEKARRLLADGCDNAEFLRQAATAILTEPDGSVRLKLKNGQTV